MEVAQKLELMQAAITQASTKVDILSGRLADADGRIGDLGENAEALAGEIATLQESLSDLWAVLDGEEGILARLERAERLCSILSIGEDGAITLGAEGVPLRLIGQVSINGTEYGGNET